MATWIRAATLDDLATIKRIAVDAQMFSTDEVDVFDDMLAGALDGSLEDHHWLVAGARAPGAGAGAGESVAVRGAAYFAPEPFADRVWNLYFLAVDPGTHGTGVGTGLIDHVEAALVRRGESEARVLLVETSSTQQYQRTRAFYAARGFTDEARVREYYGPGDDKVVFWKSLLG